MSFFSKLFKNKESDKWIRNASEKELIKERNRILKVRDKYDREIIDRADKKFRKEHPNYKGK